MDIKRILFATDYSEASEPALRVAASLARDNGAELILLHASQTEDYPVGESFDEDPQPPRDEVEMLETISSRLDGVDCVCRWVHCEGAHEADVIVNTAAKEHTDMIVVGTHGRTGLSHLLMGSVAEKVIREAPCPVLCVRQSKLSAVNA